MTKAAPDPRAVREASLDELERLALPLPPPGFPLIWEPGDTVELRVRTGSRERTVRMTLEAAVD